MRLFCVREIEEEQRRAVLESALGELQALEVALAAGHLRKRDGEALLARSIGSSEFADRMAAQIEVAAARRRIAAIAPRLAAAEIAAAGARQEYLAKRLERRQAQTLIEGAHNLHSLESGRRDQQTLDETYGSRIHRQRREADRRNRLD